MGGLGGGGFEFGDMGGGFTGAEEKKSSEKKVQENHDPIYLLYADPSLCF